MIDIELVFSRIKTKIFSLKEQNGLLTQENEELINEIIKLKQENEEKEKIIKNLENKTINLQLSKSIETEEKDKLNEVIDELIKEIDKGLELLKS